MKKNSLVFENIRLVAGVEENTPLSALPFDTEGIAFAGGEQPWDLEAWTGSPRIGSKNLSLRMTVTVPKDGWYVFGAGADWWFKVWVDGLLRLDRQGHWYPSPDDHYALFQLKAGSHTVDVFFQRGDLSARLCLGLYLAKDFPEFGDEPCSVNLSRTTGKLRRELHGSNTTVSLAGRAYSRYDEDLKKLNFMFSRTHDWALWNQGQRIIDTHFIFPLMKLDPADPTNYYFDPTDEIIRLTQDEVNMEVFYRLGTSIEHSGQIHFNAIPPEDYEKYAEVLAGIVRHYTRGWANGFHYNIRYWEIWNEPNGSENMWIAPLETFTPFFVTVLKRLKSEFPELQFGGPAMGGFDTVNFRPILEACRAAGVAPDFISWHCYTSDPDTLIRQPARMREFLDNLGFKDTKLCINEWHFLTSWEGVISMNITPEQYKKAILEGKNTLQGINSGVFNLAVLAGWQNSPLDLGMWYGAGWESPSWGYKTLFKEYSKNYWSMALFGQILRDYPVKCYSTSSPTTFVLAARSEDANKAGILVADYMNGDMQIRIPLKGAETYTKITAVILDATRNLEEIPVRVENNTVYLDKAQEGSAAFLVMLEK